MSQTPLIALAERLYRALLFLYPAKYRHEYGALMVQVFRDMSRDSYHRRGVLGLALWWWATFFDLIRTVIEQRREAVMPESRRIRTKLAAVISVILCLPFFLSYVMVVYDVEPPFMHLLTVDGYQPTSLGRIVMLVMLFSLPAAFVINLLAMITKTDSEQRTTFRLTPVHSIIGLSLLFAVLITFSDGVRYELRPFVTPLGSASMLGQIVFLLGLLVLPAAFLLNRLPRFATAGSGRRLTFRPTSVNLIIGATILLVILMIASTFMLETIACSSGVPNCD